MKHAIIGGYIASKMQNFGYEGEGKANQLIGFWVSFFADQVSFLTGNKHHIPIHSSSDEMGLIDIANFMKVLIHAEKGDIYGTEIKDLFTKGIDLTAAIDDYKGVSEGKWWAFKGLSFSSNYSDYLGIENMFNNIGIGVGALFTKIHDALPSSKGFVGKLTLYDWLVAGRAFNGDTSQPGSYTYNHCVKLDVYFRKLYGTNISQWMVDDLVNFIDKINILAAKRKPFIDAGLSDDEVRKKVPANSVFYP